MTRVLIIDDEPEMREMLEQVLTLKKLHLLIGWVATLTLFLSVTAKIRFWGGG